MTLKDLLQKYYDQACHNLLCYSKNMALNEAKEGWEKEWNEVKEECELLNKMIEEEC